MAFQPVPDTALFEWVYSTPTGIAENTYHFRGDDDWVEAALLLVAQQCYEWWATELAPTACDLVTLLRVEAKSLAAESAPFAQYAPGVLVSGSIDEAAAAANATFVIKHTTGLTGRANRGRWYMVGLPHSFGANSSVPFATAQTWATAFDTLDDTVEENGVVPVVVHRREGSVVLPVGTTTRITGHSFTDLNTDSQRRRLRGRGQ